MKHRIIKLLVCLVAFVTTMLPVFSPANAAICMHGRTYAIEYGYSYAHSTGNENGHYEWLVKYYRCGMCGAEWTEDSPESVFLPHIVPAAYSVVSITYSANNTVVHNKHTHSVKNA